MYTHIELNSCAGYLSLHDVQAIIDGLRRGAVCCIMKDHGECVASQRMEMIACLIDEFPPRVCTGSAKAITGKRHICYLPVFME
jgi:hypothetical protein